MGWHPLQELAIYLCQPTARHPEKLCAPEMMPKYMAAGVGVGNTPFPVLRLKLLAKLLDAGLYVYIYIYMYVSIYVYIYIYTHIDM